MPPACSLCVGLLVHLLTIFYSLIAFSSSQLTGVVLMSAFRFGGWRTPLSIWMIKHISKLPLTSPDFLLQEVRATCWGMDCGLWTSPEQRWGWMSHRNGKNWRISVTNQCLFLVFLFPYLFFLESHPDYSQMPHYHIYLKSSSNDFDFFHLFTHQFPFI